jgi:hypothetical protein
VVDVDEFRETLNRRSFGQHFAKRRSGVDDSTVVGQPEVEGECLINKGQVHRVSPSVAVSGSDQQIGLIKGGLYGLNEL